MKGNKIRFTAKVSMFFMICSLLWASNTWSCEETALEKYLDLQGNTYVIGGVSFVEISSSAKEISEALWPFDKKEAEQRYTDIADEIMGSLFTPAKDLSSAPLEVYLNVSLINEGKSIAALITVKIVKSVPFIDMSGEGKVSFAEFLPIVFWEKTYLYIEADYFSGEKTSKYTFREAIDKYFKEFLNRFIVKNLRHYKKGRRKHLSVRKGFPLRLSF